MAQTPVWEDYQFVSASALNAAAAQQQISLNSNILAMKAIKSSGEKCPVAATILMRAFQ